MGRTLTIVVADATQREPPCGRQNGEHAVRGFRLIVALATATAALIALPAAGLAQETAEADVETAWIVVLDDSLRADVAGQALLRGFDKRPEMTFGNVLNGFTFRGSAAAADALRNSPSVRAVVPDGVVTIAEPFPPGINRIDADEAQAPAGGNHTGAGVRIVVIDTGIDLDHPDLVANIDPNTSNHLNCQNAASSVDDDQGHGTHVSGTAAAAANGLGVIGVAPDATIVPVKAFGADGQASTSEVICGVNHAAALALDGTPTVVNMSFSEGGPDSVCDDADVTDVMHEAICDLVDAGAVPIAASGNSFANSANTMPANFSETITVSAVTDLDGIPSGLGGCQFDFLTFLNHCDDTYAGFSNYGSVVDVSTLR